jgi:hypothetical protein
MIRVTELPCLIVQGRRVSAWKTGTGEVVLEHLLRELDVPR